MEFIINYPKIVKERSLISNRRKHLKGSGKRLINTLIDRLPMELHIPGYHYCGPGTKLSIRLQRGDKRVSPLDQSCKQYDIIYSQLKDTETRNVADKELAKAALSVVGIMKGKSKLGMGLKKENQVKKDRW